MSRVMNLTILFVALTIASTKVSRSESSLNGRSSNINDYNETNESWHLEYPASSFFEDIIPDNLSRYVGRLGIELWPNGLVFFKIADEFDGQRKEYIYRAMVEICQISCVCFVPAKENMSTYLQINAVEKGCAANVGYREGVSHLYLALDEIDTGCFKLGTIKHELLHVIGLIHEQNVPNRDKYVKIIYDNIDRDYWNRFEKWSIYDLPYGEFPYDFNSIMHYPLDILSKNGKKTIVPIEDPGDVVIGHETTFSQLDIQKVNTIYNCTCTY